MNKKIIENIFKQQSYLAKDIVALCIKEYDMVIIKESLILGNKPSIIQEVIDHEVGHCVFNRIHRSYGFNYNNSIIPASIMNEHNIGKYENKELKKFYRKELINPIKFSEKTLLNKYKKELENSNKNQKEIDFLIEEKTLDLNQID